MKEVCLFTVITTDITDTTLQNLCSQKITANACTNSMKSPFRLQQLVSVLVTEKSIKALSNFIR